jgi:hypothetical protein
VPLIVELKLWADPPTGVIVPDTELIANDDGQE